VKCEGRHTDNSTIGTSSLPLAAEEGSIVIHFSQALDEAFALIQQAQEAAQAEADDAAR
jgi:hypothetical protein